MANIFSKHGAIKLSKNRKYLEHADGTPFFWLADTWWYGATSRTPMSVFKTLVKKRKKQGFSAVQIVVGIPPETDAYAKDAKNSGGYPFNRDRTLNEDYFKEVDEKIKYLVVNGIVPVIFGGWGHHIDILGIENVKKLWQEIVRRYAHYPVIFCLAGEIDLEPLKTKRAWEKVRRFLGFTRNDNLKNRIKEWAEVGNYISKIDPYKRLIAAHVSGKTTARDLLGDKKWLSINTIQSGHSKDTIPFMVNSILRNSKSNMPFINMEPWYEGILGNFGEYEQRLAFWLCILSGAKGHSYGAHGIWQMSKKNENFMKHWGDSYWRKSLEFKGAEQLCLAKKFLEKYEWWKLESCIKKVTPHWTRENNYLPVAARIGNKHFFIYVPRVGPSTLRHSSGLRIKEVSPSTKLRTREVGVEGLNSKAFYKVFFFSPKSMRSIGSFKFKGREDIIPLRESETKDLLVVISRI